MSSLNAMTSEFLHSAYGGESMASMRYLHWGNVAVKEGFPKIGKLFEAIAFAENIHAGNHYRVIDGKQPSDYTVCSGAVFGIGKTVDNLQGGINGELHEIEQMYPVYLNAAEFQNEPDAKRSFHYALEAEKIHADLFAQAQAAAKNDKDFEFESVHICPVCGHTVLNEAPDKCPVCGAKKEKYHTFECN